MVSHEVPRGGLGLAEQLDLAHARPPRGVAQHTDAVLTPARRMSQAHPLRRAVALAHTRGAHHAPKHDSDHVDDLDDLAAQQSGGLTHQALGATLKTLG